MTFEWNQTVRQQRKQANLRVSVNNCYSDPYFAL